MLVIKCHRRMAYVLISIKLLFSCCSCEIISLVLHSIYMIYTLSHTHTLLEQAATPRAFKVEPNRTESQSWNLVSKWLANDSIIIIMSAAVHEWEMWMNFIDGRQTPNGSSSRSSNDNDDDDGGNDVLCWSVLCIHRVVYMHFVRFISSSLFFAFAIVSTHGHGERISLHKSCVSVPVRALIERQSQVNEKKLTRAAVHHSLTSAMPGIYLMLSKYWFDIINLNINMSKSNYRRIRNGDSDGVW